MCSPRSFFFLLALGSYGWYAMRPGISRYAFTVGLFALGLMAKPQIVALPFALLILDVRPLQRVQGSAPSIAFPVPQFSFWRLVREKAPLLLLSAASCLITLIAQRAGIVPVKALPIVPRLLNTIYVYVAYIGKVFWPLKLALSTLTISGLAEP
jgi:protein O-mannosyl-transferase